MVLMALDITAAAVDPALLDLPWDVPLEEWPSNLLAALPRGISRHIVRFVNLSGRVLAVKEIGPTVAHHEYDRLRDLKRLDAPSVQPVAVITGRETPEVRCESWPHAVAQPVGEVFAAHAGAVDAARLDVADLLVLAPRLTGVVAETTGQPGAADPEYLVLRQRTGLLRGMRLSTVTGAVLGALDGDLTVGQTMAAVAQLLEVPAEEVAAEAIPAVRRALAEQYLIAR